MAETPEQMTFFHASLLALRGQLGHDAVDDLGGGVGIRPSGEIIAQSAAGFLQRFVHFLSFDDAVFDQEIAKLRDHQGICNSDSADVGSEIVRADHGEVPLESRGIDSNDVLGTATTKNAAAKGSALDPVFTGIKAEKDTDLGARLRPLADSKSLGECQSSAPAAGGGMSDTYIGPGLSCNCNRDDCQGKSDIRSRMERSAIRGRWFGCSACVVYQF
jgi:hypothetical protein